MRSICSIVLFPFSAFSGVNGVRGAGSGSSSGSGSGSGASSGRAPSCSGSDEAGADDCGALTTGTSAGGAGFCSSSSMMLPPPLTLFSARRASYFLELRAACSCVGCVAALQDT